MQRKWGTAEDCHRGASPPPPSRLRQRLTSPIGLTHKGAMERAVRTSAANICCGINSCIIPS